jgi:hypothetical protein
MTDDVRKLLAGYATNTLTEAERRALFEASLNDPELFAALADEQALRELLDDPATRAALLAKLEPESLSFRERFAAWLRRPATIALLGTAAVAVVVVSLLPLRQHKEITPAPVTEMAKAQVPRTGEAETLERPVSPPPAPAPAPAPARKRAKAKEEASNLPLPSVAPPPPAREERADSLNVDVQSAAQALEPKLADSAARTFRASDENKAKKSGLRYAVLKRNPDGDYVEVSANTEFEPGDTVRVRVETPSPGMVTIAEPESGRTLFSSRSTGIVETGDILLTADRTLAVLESPLPAARGAMGGVVGGVPSALSGAAPSTPSVAAQKVSQPSTLTIQLRVRKR